MGNLLTISLLKDLAGKKSAPITVLMVGMESSGKTSFLRKLKLRPGQITTQSAMGYEMEMVDYENIRLRTVSLGLPPPSQSDDHVKSGDTNRNTGLNIGPLPWQCFPNTRGLIFVVDSNNRKLLIEAKNRLYHLLNNNALRHASLLVFANKNDLPTSMTAGELVDALGLRNIRNRPWYIQSACATSTNPGQGFYEGLGWLSSTMVKYRGF